MKVHLRQRKQTKQGGISLYLEIYKGTTKTPDGKTKGLRAYEYLNLYLIDKPRSPIDKQHNKDTLKLAESIKAKRELEIKNGQYGFTSDFKTNTNFIDYFKAQTEKRKYHKGNYGCWGSVLNHLIRFAGGTKITFREIDKNFCERFKEYLLTEAKIKSDKKISCNSAAVYFQKFKACLNTAVDEEIILKSPAKNISTPKKIETKREYLTLDELKAVTKAECKKNLLKRAFLFSCLTGVRWSDVANLKWGQVEKNRIVFHQQKTKGLQYLDISKQAREILGTAGTPDERIFAGLSYNCYMNLILREWMVKAGITKQITFNSARHTHATLLYTNGVDIYKVSKRLGHSRVTTTQIYAKIIDEKMVEVANKIPAIEIDLPSLFKTKESNEEKLKKYLATNSNK